MARASYVLNSSQETFLIGSQLIGLPYLQSLHHHDWNRVCCSHSNFFRHKHWEEIHWRESHPFLLHPLRLWWVPYTIWVRFEPKCLYAGGLVPYVARLRNCETFYKMGLLRVIRSMVAPPQEAIIVIFSGPDQFPRECVLNANQAF
jgi:hypothetical protein